MTYVSEKQDTDQTHEDLIFPNLRPISSEVDNESNNGGDNKRHNSPRHRSDNALNPLDKNDSRSENHHELIRDTS
jgi:hypothetical protein